MVNWREDVEFFYGLVTVVTVIVVFFRVIPYWGTPTSVATAALAGIIMGIIGFAAFESEPAVERWQKLIEKLSEKK